MRALLLASLPLVMILLGVFLYTLKRFPKIVKTKYDKLLVKIRKLEKELFDG